MNFLTDRYALRIPKWGSRIQSEPRAVTSRSECSITYIQGLVNIFTYILKFQRFFTALVNRQACSTIRPISSLAEHQQVGHIVTPRDHPFNERQILIALI